MLAHLKILDFFWNILIGRIISPTPRTLWLLDSQTMWSISGSTPDVVKCCNALLFYIVGSLLCCWGISNPTSSQFLSKLKLAELSRRYLLIWIIIDYHNHHQCCWDHHHFIITSPQLPWVLSRESLRLQDQGLAAPNNCHDHSSLGKASDFQ